MSCQGDRLSAELKLVGLDQRGVLHSDPLPEGAKLSELDLVADFEALREELGFERWAILGQSYGGRLALRYAATCPERVDAVIFENPTWDHGTTARRMLRASLPLLDEIGEQQAAARACELLAGELPSSRTIYNETFDLTRKLGDRRMELYFHQQAVLQTSIQCFPRTRWMTRSGSAA